MNYNEWESRVPASITADSLWKMRAYRLALFASDVGWHDVTRLMQDKRTVRLADQLYESLGSIGANLAEGYSYGTPLNRARMYEYALGSARESRTWYYDGRFVLGETINQHRLALMEQIIKLLLTMIPEQRGRTLREDGVEYSVDVAESDEFEPTLAQLLSNVPLP